MNHILIARDMLSKEYRAFLEQVPTYNSECACCHAVTDVFFIKENGNMYTLCASCREARQIWGDARGKPFSVLDTEAVMLHVLSRQTGFASIGELIEEALELKLIRPA